MNFELKVNSKELAKLGILEIFFKRKLKDYCIKNIQISINQEKQLKIIDNWKKINSIKSNSELEEWLYIYDLNMDEWINLINSDYLWTLWCMNKYKDELAQYFIKRKDYLDLYYFTIIKVKSEEVADEIYLRIKENESTFEEIKNTFSYANENFHAEKKGPISIDKMEDSIASLIKIGDLNQLFQPKLSNGLWLILRKDNILKAEFNHQQKIKLSLELGEKFLNNRFRENQKNRMI